jgi:hypothetical protein
MNYDKMQPRSEFDDEMPAAPMGGAAGPQATGPEIIDEGLDEKAYDAVEKYGDAIPQGTYHCRLRSYRAQMADDGDPYFQLQWTVQEEPHTGRTAFDNCPYPNAQDIRDANLVVPNPNTQEARKKVNSRLAKAKAIMTAAGIRPGTMPFPKFLETMPELKVTLIVSERRARTGVDGKGQPMFKGTGEMGNKVVKYSPLVGGPR